MTATQHQRHHRRFHGRNQLRNGKARLHVASHRVQQKEDAVHLLRFFQLGQKRQDVFIFSGLGVGGGGHVPLDLADDGEAVDVPVGRGRHGGAEVQNGLGGLLLCIVFRLGGLGGFGHGEIPPF